MKIDERLMRSKSLRQQVFGFASLLSALALVSCTETVTPKLKVEGGKVQGKELAECVVYEGIPYAAAPVGERRWKKPQDVEPWNGVRESMTPASSDEDCLYLSIRTPKGASAHPERKLPVVVKMGNGKGGGCCQDTCQAGQELAAVEVKVTSRRGIYGFLCHPLLSDEDEEGVSGNYGVWDQVKALDWVQAHIAQFGGDPENVTVKGDGLAIENLPQDVLDAPGEDMFNIAGVYSLDEMRALTPERIAEVMANYEAVQKRQLVARPHTDGGVITEDIKHVGDLWMAKRNATSAGL